MSKSTIPRGDRLLALGMDVTSRFGSRFPRVGRLFVGDNPIHWHATDTHADEIEDWHVNEPEYVHSGWVAKTYKTAVVLETDRDKLVNRALQNNTRPAAAFAAGKAVLATELYKAGLEFDSFQDTGLVRVSMRVGRGALYGALGEYDPTENTFTPADIDDVRVVGSGVPADELSERYPDALYL